MAKTDAGSGSRRPLRLWPGVALAVLAVAARYVAPALDPELIFYGGVVGMACALAIVLWWLLFSRAPWLERIGAVVLMVLTVLVAGRFVHVSIRTGMMGFMLPVYAIQVMALALVAWAVATRRMSDSIRRVTMVATILAVGGVFGLLRTDGIWGGSAELAWRWSPTAEERLLAEPAARIPSAPPELPAPIAPPDTAAPITEAPPVGLEREAPAAPTSAPAVVESVPEWPGFRGPGRDGVVRGAEINTDWSASPPVEIWRRPIGPGWSSFAVHGDLIYTQEQRGDDEVVSAYALKTGEPVWAHRDPVRFWESNGGAGPRATPTLGDGRVYTFGATGVLNALDAGTGALAWSRDVASESKRAVPIWGFSSSPLVIDDLVVVAAAGTLVAYDRATGERRWMGPSYGGSYSSPHRATFDGVEQVVLLGGPGAISVDPANGAVLWEHVWEPGAIVQPALTADGDILVNTIAATGGLGIRRLAVSREPAGWSVEERWTSRGLKPYFNDFVVHDGHAYGFDGTILSCIDLTEGSRAWKGGRYGEGQLILLADSGVLLVLSGDGEVALVRAEPDRFTELARFAAIDGKTWNHPVVVGDVLLVRNGVEMAAFRLALARR